MSEDLRISQRAELESAELIQLSRGDWETFSKKFRDVFLERLMELATQPGYLDIRLPTEIQKLEHGQKINYTHKNVNGIFAMLAQDARLLPEVIDKLKAELFT